ncbi:autoinducer binding domain-containing protein [Alphaproteobacteria bacterium KMM 3653]|uniref:Autoinducer binding domain-containing protein n=1 Tax=Harenicola maris TaxID=2841044 RepID=A0AAP2CM44_9RHOB|nr:autoinducer binding domain-containing protein [Harenicola maris]
MIDYIDRVCRATSLEELWDYHCIRMAEFGFTRLFYGYTRFRTATSVGDMQDLLLLTNHESSYVEGFFEDGLFWHAPMVRWALSNVGACSWRWMGDQARAGTLTEKELKVVDFNLAHGVTAGYSISFSDASPRFKGAIALTSPSGVSQQEADEIWAEHGQTLVAMNSVAHLKLASLPHSGSRRPLTTRQREALEWVGEGKTMQDIATIMGLTQATVEKHLRLAREALAVDTTAQAVLKASMQNQIYHLER